MDDPGIESRLGARFSSPVQTGTGAHPASYTMGTGSFPEVKRPRRGIDYSPPSRAEVEERVELYICSPSGPLWPVIGWTFLCFSVYYISEDFIVFPYKVRDYSLWWNWIIICRGIVTFVIYSNFYILSEWHSEINLLKPTGHVMHQQFNIQQLYALPTLYLCVLYLSVNKQRLVPLTA